MDYLHSNTTLLSTSGFIPPSEEIQRLFVFDQNKFAENSSKSNQGVAEEYSFTEEEFAKMPSTLMKIVRRTDELLVQTESVRKLAIETNNEVKSIHTLLIRYAKKTLKDSEKIEATVESNTEKKTQRGFRRQCIISNELCEFMGLPHGSTSSRVEVNQVIDNYIKSKGLIEKNNILPDEKLSKLLSADAKGNKITYFSIQKYIKHHYIKPTNN
jgi:chromatin remodeling complex protein RSC6